jgi:hypothetical protein
MTWNNQDKTATLLAVTWLFCFCVFLCSLKTNMAAQENETILPHFSVWQWHRKPQVSIKNIMETTLATEQTSRLITSSSFSF